MWNLFQCLFFLCLEAMSLVLHLLRVSRTSTTRVVVLVDTSLFPPFFQVLAYVFIFRSGWGDLVEWSVCNIPHRFFHLPWIRRVSDMAVTLACSISIFMVHKNVHSFKGVVTEQFFYTPCSDFYWGWFWWRLVSMRDSFTVSSGGHQLGLFENRKRKSDGFLLLKLIPNKVVLLLYWHNSLKG